MAMPTRCRYFLNKSLRKKSKKSLPAVSFKREEYVYSRLKFGYIMSSPWVYGSIWKYVLTQYYHIIQDKYYQNKVAKIQDDTQYCTV